MLECPLVYQTMPCGERFQIATRSDEEDEKAKDEEDKPTEESLDKLATLEPLPKLLSSFDLDAHVGLIQRILSEDPQLVKMQSKLSGTCTTSTLQQLLVSYWSIVSS